MTRTARPSEAEITRVLDAVWASVRWGEVVEADLTWLHWENQLPEAVFLPPGLPDVSVWTVTRAILRLLCRTPTLAPFEDEVMHLIAARRLG